MFNLKVLLHINSWSYNISKVICPHIIICVSLSVLLIQITSLGNADFIMPFTMLSEFIIFLDITLSCWHIFSIDFIFWRGLLRISFFIMIGIFLDVFLKLLVGIVIINIMAFIESMNSFFSVCIILLVIII